MVCATSCTDNPAPSCSTSGIIWFSGRERSAAANMRCVSFGGDTSRA